MGILCFEDGNGAAPAQCRSNTGMPGSSKLFRYAGSARRLFADHQVDPICRSVTGRGQVRSGISAKLAAEEELGRRLRDKAECC
jgi:hypothetical protein